MSLISYKNLSAYFACAPAECAGKPGIILLQEWWGLNDQMKRMADRFAAQGFCVILPDLYHGKVAKDANEANHLMSGLNFPAAVDECKVWAEYLKQEKKCSKVGATGFCMGGALTVACASKLSADGTISAGSVFYGIPDASYFPVKPIACPLLLNFGKKDDHKGFSDPETVEKLAASLKAEGKQFELHWYEDSGHAFMNDARPEAFSKQNSEVAFKRTVDFFKKHLQ